jgi:CubicO group peptidase (beta-lactamase class C family)
LLQRVLGVITLALLAMASQVGAQTPKLVRGAAVGAEIPETKPESVGFSAERLARLDSSMKSLVDSRKLAGMVTVLARHGKIVEEKTYGYADERRRTGSREFVARADVSGAGQSS